MSGLERSVRKLPIVEAATQLASPALFLGNLEGVPSGKNRVGTYQEAGCENAAPFYATDLQLDLHQSHLPCFYVELGKIGPDITLKPRDDRICRCVDLRRPRRLRRQIDLLLGNLDGVGKEFGDFGADVRSLRTF